ncbi:MAG: polysaccharide deacetylase family protein [Armatimonadota bacterium]|nr:polysaccharide deacetylase family protein [Armatimonadota bacterium]
MLTVAVVIGVAAGNYLGRMSTNSAAPPIDATSPSGKHGNQPSVVREERSEHASAADRLPERRDLKAEASQPSADTHSSPTENPNASKPEEHSTHSSAALLEPRKPRGLAGGRELAQSRSSNLIALTFDAGASSAPTASLLDTLRSAGLHVTFFLTGKWCERNETLVRRIANEGHEIANHTYSHPDLRKLSSEAIREELTKTDEIVTRITGQHCAPYFRPPYGSRDRRVIEAARQAGFTCVYWSVDSWDAFKRGITPDEIKTRVLSKAKAGDIVLMHCGSPATAEALPEIIQELESRGLRIVPVSELLSSQE